MSGLDIFSRLLNDVCLKIQMSIAMHITGIREVTVQGFHGRISSPNQEAF